MTLSWPASQPMVGSTSATVRKWSNSSRGTKTAGST
jgi:hypothetical protein